MDLNNSQLLVWLPLIPVAGGILISLFTRRMIRLSGLIAVGLIAMVLLIVIASDTIVLPWQTQPQNSDVTWTNPWIPSLNLNVNLSLDGYSGWMIIMTAITSITCLLFAFLVEVNPSSRRIVSLLILTSGAFGVFLARDILSFSFAWGIWLVVPFCVDSRQPDRHRPSSQLKLFVFHLLSLFLITTGLAMVHFGHLQSAGIQNLDISSLARISLPLATQRWVLAFLLTGIAIRMPLFPFHGWLSDVLDELPSSISAMITSTSLAIGIFAILRFIIPLCPDACLDLNKYIIFAALFSMVYGALVALMNPHLLQRIGFVCMSYAGLHLLGLFTLNGTGFIGATLASANFIPTSAVLILCIGWLTTRTNSVLIQDAGGVWHKCPLIAVIFLLASLAFVGVPGLNMFPGIFLIIGGVIQTQPVWAALALVAFLILATGMLWMFQKVFTGKISPAVDSFKTADDMVPGRILIPVTALIIWFGFFPQYMIQSFSDSTDTVHRYIQSHRMYKKTSPGMTPMEHFFQQHNQRKD